MTTNLNASLDAVKTQNVSDKKKAKKKVLKDPNKRKLHTDKPKSSTRDVYNSGI